MNIQSVAALTAALLALAGCDKEQTRSANAIIDNLTGVVNPVVPVPVINDPVVADVDVIAPAAVEEPVTVAVVATPIVEECVSIFRVQTCEDGVLHHLDDNFNWID